MLRTPNAGNANNVRICNTGNGGALNNNNANNSNGVAPLGGIVSFEYGYGKQCISRKESVSCIRKERKRPVDGGGMTVPPICPGEFLINERGLF